MTSINSGQPDPEDVRRLNRADRRRERIRQQVQQARHGRKLIPTWLMAAVLALFLAGWVYLIVTK
ncbi:hypothetical protein ACWT_5110 [Actinoplanes sp. SE50]|uniref:hypothetical protein n=1 Tax=unclassified Actinoplanes TaxID=2626549 RepID=UPI00023ED299|nr:MULTISPECIES: hypothetical protein [unclassified Actinoplanes]AEV86127.1 hypothetical protein ACPL_5240 [Actinoplanes sp. SE50/110]ATO84525.1 hypothetical protein ACWT_5110 [Actinoplanes sp. SE50]SLM01935.1 hypothetical protein ACSP50_5173 [Actinoplanes sp. SE50/110]